jgi:hypothetical protein
MSTATKLVFDHDSGRYLIGERELHCGDTFQIRRGEACWMDVRIEHSSRGWYLVGLPPGLDGSYLDEYEARLYVR